MTVSNKVVLYALVPAAFILLFGSAVLFIYPTSIEAKVSIVSSLATSVTVLVLVGERLRDSALRKLEFLNKQAFSPALRASKGTVQSIAEDQSRMLSRSSDLLKRHGKFLGWKLFPKNLITALEKAAEVISGYEKLWWSVYNAGIKAVGPEKFNIWALLKGLDFYVQGNYTPEMTTPQMQFFETLKTSDPETAKQFPIKVREILRLKSEILKKLDEFFADNLLEEVREPSYVPVGAGPFS